MKKSYAVIGHPIGHTMSPFIHKRLFELQNQQAEYTATDIAPDSLKAEMSGVLSSLEGFNVTIPHKEAILPLLDRVDGSALKYSAVNCVLRKDGLSFGCSTDAYGFTKALEANGVELKGSVLVLGAGGAARTLAREAADNGCFVTVAVRDADIEKAESLKGWITDNGGKADTCLISEVDGEYDLIVNATPVGMYPNTEFSVLAPEQIKCKAVFDAVYNPERTLLIRLAEEKGIKTVGGMAMLVWQAVKAHEFWYNAEFETADIERLIADANREMARIFYEK